SAAILIGVTFVLAASVMIACVHPLGRFQRVRTVQYPLPHQVPKKPGGLSFRFAMIHDVVHERYPRHGKAFYEERNRRALAAIERNKEPDGLPHFDLYGLVDDLGVGLDALGQYDEAIRWMRLKLKAQKKLGFKGKDLYTSYANLGTFLTYANADR